MRLCGENGANFDKRCDGKPFVGGFKSFEGSNCTINRTVHLGYFDPFVVISSAKILFENKWRGETLGFVVNNKKIEKKPTYRVDFHKSLCEGDNYPDRLEDVYWVYEMKNSYLSNISLLDNFDTFSLKHLNWGFRELLNSVIGCPPGSKKDLSNKDIFTCVCIPGYYRDFSAKYFTCRELSSRCQKGNGPYASNCTECFFPFSKPDEDPNGECILDDCNMIFKINK